MTNSALVENSSAEMNEETSIYPLNENDEMKIVKAKPKKLYRNKYEIVWRNVFLMLLLHISGLVGLYLMPYIQLKTIFFAYFVTILSSIGVQGGAHRLWTHRSYEANFPLRCFLAICHIMALQNDVYEWARDHRAHHKFSETDADPHDSTKGFFFSHIGWLLVKKHPDVFRRGGTIDLSDLEADPIVRFQRKFYIPLVALFWGIIPVFVPVLGWNENLILSGFMMMGTRYMISLNITWLVNSWAHIYGSRPYDKRIDPVEASIRHLLMGEGFHNYHHAFPWDYSASELGIGHVFNPATAFIDFFAWMGWAWNLKKADPELVKRRMGSTGNTALAYQKNRVFFEWLTGLATILLPLALMVFLNKL